MNRLDDEQTILEWLAEAAFPTPAGAVLEHHETLSGEDGEVSSEDDGAGDGSDLKEVPDISWAELGRSDARWAADVDSPDYHHLNEPGKSQVFTFTTDHLRQLCNLNAFGVEHQLTRNPDITLFGLRGCRLASTEDHSWTNAVQLVEDMPDHYDFHCVLGVWNRRLGNMAVFSGSTVPNWHYMEQQRTGRRRTNLLPTGMYRYRVGTHGISRPEESRRIYGAFRLNGTVVVLRSNDDLTYERTDLWDRTTPADNIHPSRNPQRARFSSAGCHTIPGNATTANGRTTHTGNWRTFRERAGLSANDTSEDGAQFDYVLLTGREARMVSTDAHLLGSRLRFGSSGPAVTALQQGLQHLGHSPGRIDDQMGPSSTSAFIRWQQARNGGAADGIVTPSVARELGFDLVGNRSIIPAVAQTPSAIQPVVQPVDWCQMRETIAAAALGELARWRRNGNVLTESTPSQLPILQQYWSAVPQVARRSGAAARRASGSAAGNVAWSAAFICSVMRSVGITEAHGFNRGPAHSYYVVGALRNRERSDQTKPFWLLDRAEMHREAKPEKGDLLCFNRCRKSPGTPPANGCKQGKARTRHSYSSLRRKYWEDRKEKQGPNDKSHEEPRYQSHCSIVVGTELRNGVQHVVTIGGNEGNSVKLNRFALNADGGIANHRRARHMYGMIKIIAC